MTLLKSDLIRATVALPAKPEAVAEQAEIDGIVRGFLALQARSAAAQRRPLGRGTHPKGVCVRAVFEVLDLERLLGKLNFKIGETLTSCEQRFLPRIVQKDEWTVSRDASGWPKIPSDGLERHVLDLHIGYSLRFHAVMNRQCPGHVVIRLKRRIGRKLLRLQ